MMIANNKASSAKPRPDINGSDTVQTVWTELVDQKVLIGGVYRRNRPSQPELEREEFDQLIKQIFKQFVRNCVKTGFIKSHWNFPYNGQTLMRI